VRPPTINATVTALRFFFKVTLDRPEATHHLVFVYEPRKLPRVLSAEEVLRLLEAAPHSSPRAIVIAAQAKPIDPTSTRIHPTAAPKRLAPTRIAAIKSP
jgi:integrase